MACEMDITILGYDEEPLSQDRTVLLSRKSHSDHIAACLVDLLQINYCLINYIGSWKLGETLGGFVTQ